MTQDAFVILSYLIREIWRLFTSLHIPGTNVTFAGWAYFSLLVVFTVRMLNYFLHGGGDK